MSTPPTVSPTASGATALGYAASTYPWSSYAASKTFPDSQAQWIWSNSTGYDVSATDVYPVFSTTINVTQNTQLLMNILVDDIAYVYVNGMFIKTITTNWNLPSYPIPLPLSTGTIVIYIRVVNTGGAAGVVASITSSDGRTVFSRTGSDWFYRDDR